MTDSPTQLYYCEGKPGVYEHLGSAIGAGTSRGRNAEVYRDIISGQLFLRDPADFAQRMKLLGAIEPPMKQTLAQKVASNTWDNLDDVIRIVRRMRAGTWAWMYNPDCKYLDLRVDMRDGGCLIRNRHGVRIDPTDLADQGGDPR